MNRNFGMVMAAGLVLGHASVADAQFSMSLGNPYMGSGVQIGQPYYGSGYGTGGVGTTYYGSGYSSYSSGYSSYAAPGTSSFITGSYAPTPDVYPAPVYGLAPVVAVPYSTYGYRSYRRGVGIPFVGRFLGGRRW